MSGCKKTLVDSKADYSRSDLEKISEIIYMNTYDAFAPGRTFAPWWKELPEDNKNKKIDYLKKSLEKETLASYIEGLKKHGSVLIKPTERVKRYLTEEKFLIEMCEEEIEGFKARQD